MGAGVFISYRRSDVGVARAMAELLESLGELVFLDVKSIRLGQSWEAAILQAAREANTMLVLWSRNAAASSYIRREWAMASPSCRLIPIRLDGSELPPELASRQALDLKVGERLLARISELQGAGMSHQAASEQLVDELRREGVELQPRQRRALFGVAAAFGGSSLAALGWLARRSLQSVLSPAGALAGAGAGAALLASIYASNQTQAADDCHLALAQVTAAASGVVVAPPGPSASSPTSPSPSFSPASLDLQHRAVGWQEKVFATLKLTNPTDSTLALTPRVTVLSGAPVKLVDDACRNVSPHSSCDVKLQIGPVDAIYPDVVAVHSVVDAGNARADIVGFLAPRAPAPDIASRLVFESRPVRAPAASRKFMAMAARLPITQPAVRQVLTIKSGSEGGGLKLSSYAVAGANVFAAAKGQCTNVLPPNGTCDLAVEFKPQGPEPQSAELELTFNTGGVQRVALEGTVFCVVPDMSDVSTARPPERAAVLTESQKLAKPAGFASQIVIGRTAPNPTTVVLLGQQPAKGTTEACGQTITTVVGFDAANVSGLF